jgi:hypothetical protein
MEAPGRGEGHTHVRAQRNRKQHRHRVRVKRGVGLIQCRPRLINDEARRGGAE